MKRRPHGKFRGDRRRGRPRPDDGKPHGGKPSGGKPSGGKPSGGKPSTERVMRSRGNGRRPGRHDVPRARSEPGGHRETPPRRVPEARRDPPRRAPEARRDPPRRAPEARRDPARRAPEARRDPAQSGPPRIGEWLFTTREGAERDLIDEFGLAGETNGPRQIAPAIVVAPRLPRDRPAAQLTFARQGFPIQVIASAPRMEDLATQLVETLTPRIERGPHFALHVFVPDSTAGNPLSNAARALESAMEALLSERLGGASRVSQLSRSTETVPLVQICLFAENRALGGVLPSSDAPSPFPGGRARMHVPGDRPSRAARKLAEALNWFGLAPESGELCVDLGAAPGGWTWLLLERRARVIAVDPGTMRPDLLERRGLTTLRQSAFDFEPEEPADWLFCDMAWRPLEVAEMLARWARRRSATFLVANFKLPMKRKAEMVERVLSVLGKGGWRDLRSRQLYHDRDEITVTARL